MGVQMSYSLKPAEGFDGQKYDLHEGTDVSRTVETAPISFGRVVSKGSTDRKVVLGGAAPRGICVRQLELEGGIPQIGEVVAVRTKGFLYASVDGAGNEGDALHYVLATGLLTTAAVDAGVIAETSPVVKLCRTKTSGTAIVPVEIG